MNRAKTYGKQLDLALSTWVKLARATALVGRHTGEHIRTCGLTVAQFGALETLFHRGPMTPGELCAKQLVSGGNMTVVLDHLEQAGLVRRVPSTHDRRSVTVHLTPDGTALMERKFPEHARVVGDVFEALSGTEQRQLGDLLRKLGLSLRANSEVRNTGEDGARTTPRNSMTSRDMRRGTS